MSARPKLLRVAATGGTCAAKLRRVVATGATCAAKLRRVVATMIYPRSRSDQADSAHMSMRFETFLSPAQKSGIPWQVRAYPEQTRADSVQILTDSCQTRAASGPPARLLGATSSPPRGHQSATSGPPVRHLGATGPLNALRAARRNSKKVLGIPARARPMRKKALYLETCHQI